MGSRVSSEYLDWEKKRALGNEKYETNIIFLKRVVRKSQIYLPESLQKDKMENTT